ncbi:hypothetical protein F5Y15DRAFT_410162 [Xylariaceae sp. FL0016]|nr:hypothetical protein F5Y15DRAFT_410162 [Xylariaceae sp. FL0016]
MSHPQTLFSQTSFHGPSMLQARRQVVARTTLKSQLARMKESGQYCCFDLKWQPSYGDNPRWPSPSIVYWDSDVAKWIEGACYVLQETFDAEIDAAVRELVDLIGKAQHEDGYLNVYFTVVKPGERWSNLRDQHELYNCGHLIEAALAHSKYYKNNLLLDPIQKYVKLIRSVFGPGKDQRHGYGGHPEIELALLRLYTVTKNEDAYDLAKYFIEERGNPTGQEGMRYYDWERKQRGDNPWKRPDCYPMHKDHWYNQAHKPILEQHSIEGHAVRALYLYTGVADLCCLDRLELKEYETTSKYLDVLHDLWNNMVNQKMYLTGGVGSMHQWEGFGIDYFLPQGTAEGGCYNETCASIAIVMLAERFLHMELDARYADVAELCLYNNIMTGMSLDGKAFTYVNQLASSEQDKSVREEWFDTSCCPPNVTRLFGSLGGYLWDYGGYGDDLLFINVHHYTTAKVTFQANGQDVVFEQESNWPWEGKIAFQLHAPSSSSTTVRLRIPQWTKGRFTVCLLLFAATDKRNCVTSQHKKFAIAMEGFEPRFISPHPYTNQNTLALTRGPLIYCVEDVDNSWEHEHFRNVGISPDSAVSEQEKMVDDIGERYIELRTTGWVRKMDHWLQRDPGVQPGSCAATPAETEQKDLIFVPYYLRANRGGNGHMRVGLLNMKR